MQAKQPHSKHETLTERTIYFKKQAKIKIQKPDTKKGKKQEHIFSQTRNRKSNFGADPFEQTRR